MEQDKVEKFYDKNYKKLLLIPNILLIIALAIIIYHYSTTGEIINKDVSLKGGVTATVYTDKQVDINKLETYLKTKLGDALIRRLSEFGTDKQIGFVIDTGNTNGDLLKQELEDQLNLKLDQSNYSSEQFGSSLGQSFYRQMLIALGLSFLFMAIVVFITFRSFIPSIAVVYAAFMDIVIPVAITILFNIKISAAGISALLMLIGYSIDTDILLTTRVLKRKEGSIWERMTSSAKTGLTMTFAAIIALLSGYFITSSLVLKEMFFIIVIGLFTDIPSTWLMNAGVLKWYVGKKKMSLKKIFNLRVNLLLIAIIIAILAINPNPFAKGVQIKSVEQGSVAYEQGIKEGEIIKEINSKPINTLADYQQEISKLSITPQDIIVITDKGTYSYIITNDIGFRIDQNLTVIASTVNVEKDSKLYEINNVKINSLSDFDNLSNDLIKKTKLDIITDKGEYVFLIAGDPKIQVGNAETTNIKKGLDLEGGTRALLSPEAENNQTVTGNQVSDLIKVLGNRLDVYGLKDLKIRPATDLSGNKFVLIEIAGVSKEEVQSLIEQQGKFEANIGNDLVFTGGNDIKFVCREDGTCSGIRQCSQISADQWSCNFEFRITLSPEAAKKQADITKNLDVNITESGNRYLSKTLDLYLDNKKLDSLQISEDLKGKETTDILISGPGVGRTKLEAYNDALANMDKLQTILITGSLPLKLNIVKLDSISPTLGQQFIKSSFIIGIVAMIGVAIVIYVRYRKLKIIIPMVITVLSEILITLGIAALIKWNLDVASIAGIIVAVGTGVDDQIVITDEVLKGSVQSRYYNWKEKIKRAMFIVFSAYAATLAAMFPLFFAGAGLIRGFAVTTIIGISVGVFLTRPAYASIVENLLEE